MTARHAPPHKQGGFIQNLIVPGLLAISVALVTSGYLVSLNAKGQAVAAAVDLTRAQLETLRGVLSWCRVMYPAGNNGTGYYLNLPSSPSDGSWTSARTLVCPGNPGVTLWQSAQQQLGMPGTFLADWDYKNVAGGVYVRISQARAGDPYGEAVLKQVASRIHPSQKQLTGSALEILVVQ